MGWRYLTPMLTRVNALNQTRLEPRPGLKPLIHDDLVPKASAVLIDIGNIRGKKNRVESAVTGSPSLADATDKNRPRAAPT
jgi:hypothetical protein